MILVYLENQGSELPKSALVSIGAALKAKEKTGAEKVVGLLVGGTGVEEAANEAAKYGLDEVRYFKNETLDNYLAVNYEQVVAGTAKELGAEYVISNSGSIGKDLMPRVALKLNAGQASDVIEFLGGGKLRRPMYAGDFIADVEVLTPVKVVTIRVAAFEAAGESGSAAVVNEISVEFIPKDSQKFIEKTEAGGDRPELTDADIVISGGRALKSKENFDKYMGELADVLGAAIGASRAAVDSGYAPNDWQVGQTGKVVAPNLYIAFGISGAIQHLAGMKDSKVIVAVNKDPEAPIFEVADYGLVADLFDVIPELKSAIEQG